MRNASVSMRLQAKNFSRLFCSGVLLFGVAAQAQQSQPQPSPPAGPQPRAVRLSSVEGEVQLAQGNKILASQALANTPLFEGTEISTTDDGRAEIQFEDGSVARVSPNSSLTLATLGQQGTTLDTDLVLNRGLGYFEIQGDSQTVHIKVHFGDNVATASGFTVLRINLDYLPGEVAVFSGNAHVDGGASLAVDLHGGESVKLNGPDSGNYALAETIKPDSWDAWNTDRDQVLTAEEANRTAATSGQPNDNNPAWSDLDSNGSWYNMPGQGYVWSPNEAASASWDPYGCGSWVWTPRFGYMWVSCESWGYMPYTSGTWGYYDGLGWGWAPGLGVPWWFGGVWRVNIGNGPIHYRPPHRPIGAPRPGGPIRVGGRYQPYPVVAVNRAPSAPAGVATFRVRNAPVTVAGNTLQPLRPMSPRPVYSPGIGNSVMGRGSVGYAGAGLGVHSGYSSGYTAAGGRSGYATAPSSGAGEHFPASAHYYSGYSTPHVAAPSHPSYGGGGGAPASHPSGGGSAGGGSHPSGGGGAAHASGGSGHH